jgi:hypothetical protein
MRTIYRIELPDSRDGMWYNSDGELKKKIHLLCPNGVAKDFPMPFNPLYRKDGKVWQSAGKNIENMNQWFTADDAMNLYKNGYRLYEYQTEVYQELEMEILFCRENVISQKEIPLNKVWNIELN